MTIEEVLKRDIEFRYMLLGRMKTDCYYYLQTEKNYKYLWANNEYKQIEYMKAIWNSFPEDGKPQWLTMEHIESLERQMTPWLGDTPIEELKDLKPIYVGDLIYYDKGQFHKPDHLSIPLYNLLFRFQIL